MNVSLSNFTLNGNQGGDSTTGTRRGADGKVWYCGVNLMNLDNILIENVVVVNTPAYHIRLSNVGNVKATGSVMKSDGSDFNRRILEHWIRYWHGLACDGLGVSRCCNGKWVTLHLGEHGFGFDQGWWCGRTLHAIQFAQFNMNPMAVVASFEKCQPIGLVTRHAHPCAWKVPNPNARQGAEPYCLSGEDGLGYFMSRSRIIAPGSFEPRAKRCVFDMKDFPFLREFVEVTGQCRILPVPIVVPHNAGRLFEYNHVECVLGICFNGQEIMAPIDEQKIYRSLPR
jgi:hypothetical protein